MLPFVTMTHSITPPWRQCLYLSRLAEGCGYEIFAGLAQRARSRNAAQGTGGCLLFDGQRFCQLIEGPEPAATALWVRIGADPRHRVTRLLLDRSLPAHAQPPVWDYGYCGADDLDCLDGAHALHGLAALDAFEAIRARADLAR